MSDKYEKQVYLAMLAEQCSRYEDMMAFLEDMVKAKTEDLSSDERNLLSIAYKNTISLDRQAIRTLLAYESKEAKKAESPYLDYIKEYKAKVQKELEDLCNKINRTIDDNLLPKATTEEAKVFYHKMKGDYCALNLSVFYYEVVGNKEEACKLAEDTLSKSKEALNGADEEEDEVKDAMSIVNLLEENLMKKKMKLKML